MSQGRELDPNIILLQSWAAEDMQTEAQAQKNALKMLQFDTKIVPISASQVNLSSQTSPSRPQHQSKRRSVYQGELVQPRKCVRRGN